MRASTTFIALAIAAVSAQKSNSSLPDFSVNPNDILLETRAKWCQGQTNTCGLLCDKNTKQNRCSVSDLTYECQCSSNGSAPGLEYYKNSMYTHKCEFSFNACINAKANDAQGQEACINNIQKKCGQNAPPEARVGDSSKDDGAGSPTSAATATASNPRAGTAITSTTSGGFAAPTMAPAGKGAVAVAALGFAAYLF